MSQRHNSQRPRSEEEWERYIRQQDESSRSHSAGRKSPFSRGKLIALLAGVAAATALISAAVNAGSAPANKAMVLADEGDESDETVSSVTVETTTTKAADNEDLKLVVRESLLTDSPNYKYTDKIEVKGLMLHSIGQQQPSASKQAKVFGDSNYWEAGVHAFIDAETGEVVHTLPWDQEAWHCGYDEGNKYYIGVEMCETDAAHYTDTFKLVVEDKKEALRHVKTAYDSAVRLFAQLCIKYDLDPLEEGVIVSHKEGHALGIATNHGDPDNYWKESGSGYTMDGFRKAVNEYKAKYEELDDSSFLKV